MRTGHEAATLGLMTPTGTIHRCFWIGTADIYLCQTQYQFFSYCCQDEFQEYLRSEENHENIDRALDKQRYSSVA